MILISFTFVQNVVGAVASVCPSEISPPAPIKGEKPHFVLGTVLGSLYIYIHREEELW